MKIELDKNVIVASAPVLYDATATQEIPLDLPKGRKKFRVHHFLKPPTKEQYFAFASAHESIIKRMKHIAPEILSARHNLWKEIAEKRSGYVEREDWREVTAAEDATQAINALLFTEMLVALEDSDEAEEFAETALFDESEDTPIQFKALFSGALVELALYFREPNKAEKDSFMAIIGDRSDSNRIASAVKKSKPQKLYELGAPMITRSEGYAGEEIAAWHVAAATEAFFVQQLGRLGKQGFF